MFRLRDLTLVSALALAAPAVAWPAPVPSTQPTFKAGFNEQTQRTGPGSLAFAQFRGRVVVRSDFARQQGYNDGYAQGLNDARGRRRYDPISTSRYRSADHGYNSRFGPREDFRFDYRDAFRQGYDRGFAEGRRTPSRSIHGFFGFRF